MRWRGICLGLAVGMASGLALGAARVHGGEDDEADVLIREFFRPLAWFVTQVETNYVDEVDRRSLLQGAYQGMLSKADPASAYVPAAMTAQYGPDADGTVAELGMTVRLLPLRKTLVVDRAPPGGPAFQAGVRAGDYIIEIKEEGAEEATATEKLRTDYDALKALHGEPGSRVLLTIARVDEERRSGERKDVSLVRSSAGPRSVRGIELIEPESGIGYLALTDFSERTPSQLIAALRELQDFGARGVVVDLRFNAGGQLHGAVVCADELLDKGIILTARGRDGRTADQASEEADAFPGLKLVLLVNGYTAGAAEVLAGALADNNRAVLVGQKTRGLGSMQASLDCPYDGSTLKLAVARYVRPNGEAIEPDGIKPQVEVDVPPEDVQALTEQMAARLAGPDEPFAAPAKAPSKEGEEPQEFRDVQLERAVEELRGRLTGTGAAVAAAHAPRVPAAPASEEGI